ncbi:alpha-1,6-mannosyl-glycoprotein 2-beta-N-acetylglucosaminyltransferase-like [Haemaphysalis longicornis]
MFHPKLSYEYARLSPSIVPLKLPQSVHHASKFGALAPSDPVIVVQVHDRWHYLKHLLHSLSRVRGIERALLVLSHDHYDEQVLGVSKSANFCKVMQIFFPNSTQLYPYQFPGNDPNDCPRNTPTETARKIKCNNANFPDHYGHYRESKFTTMKHHWWWKLNFVLEGMNATRNHSGPFLLLEEDYYVSPDYLSAVALMLKSKPNLCGRNLCLCMVGNMRGATASHMVDKVDLRLWKNNTNNLGIIITRDTWQAIRNCSNAFCTYDDYNWDLTLTGIAGTCFPPGSLAVSLSVSRVYHIGDSGMHPQPKRKPGTLLQRALNSIPQGGFGSEGIKALQAAPPKFYRIPKLSGGWADVRDHQLCSELTL